MALTAAMLMLSRQRKVPSSKTTLSPSVPSSSFHAMNDSVKRWWWFLSGTSPTTTSAFMQRSEVVNKSNQSTAVSSSE